MKGLSKGRYDKTFAGEDAAQSDQRLCYSLIGQYHI